MDINQNINSQKSAIDLSQFTKHQNLPDKETTRKPDSTVSNASLNASTVNLSKEGRAASFEFDFNATTENLSRLDTLKNSDSFTKAHASISYDKVKHLLD